MVELQQKFFPDVSLRDLRTTIGVVMVCQESGELLSRASGQSADPQLRQVLSRVARQRRKISAQLIPEKELSNPVVKHVQQDFEEEIAAYKELEERLGDSADQKVNRDWVEEFHQADQKVLRSLRSAMRKIEGQDLATRLSSLVASYRLSSECLHRKHVRELASH